MTKLMLQILFTCLVFRFLEILGVAFISFFIQWHCNFYSLFRSCRLDRNLFYFFFAVYKLCDWWWWWCWKLDI